MNPLGLMEVDIYQRNVNKMRKNAGKSYPNGSSSIVSMAANSVVDDGATGLAHAYKRARDDSESLKERGEKERAELIREQYMQESFLPAVEIVVNSTSPDEVLNNKSALSLLDKYALLEGSGKGYTASYIREAYGPQLGQVVGHSDAYTQAQMRRLNMLLDKGEVRAAYGLANKLRKQIDDGEHIADNVDYELIGRIVSYYK